MPRSSRHKSKRTAKDAREYSDTEEDLSKGKYRGGSRGYKESCSGSGEKRKLASQSVAVKDSSAHGNGYSSEEYVGSKKRKVKSDQVGSDRWNGSGEVLGLESKIREEGWRFDGKVLKSKGLIDLRSKIGIARRDVEKKEEDVGLFLGEEEKSEKIESKRRLDKDISEKEKLHTSVNRKDEYQLKDARENQRGSESDSRLVDRKRELDYQAVDSEEQKVKKGVESKGSLEDDFGKHDSEKDRDRRRKKRTSENDDNRDRDTSDIVLTSRRERDKDGKDRDERHRDISSRDKHYFASEEVYGKNESEKDHEMRRRKRTDESDDKDKYKDRDRDSSDKRRERDKDGRNDDERQKDISNRDKNRDYYDRDGKGRDVDKREGADRDKTQKFDDFKDDHTSIDNIVSKNDSKYVRDENEFLDSWHKKSRPDSDRNVKYDGQGYWYKDYKETRESMDKEDYGDMRSRIVKDYRESENKSACVREENIPDRERSHSFLPDESTLGQSRRKRSPSSIAHATRDQYRYSKQAETKYREPLPDERPRSNLNAGKEEDIYHASDFSSERHRSTDRRMSLVGLTDKSQSPSSTEHRHLSRTSDRSLDYEDSENRNNRYKDKNHHYYDGKRMQDMKVEAPSKDGSSQIDGDNVPFTSSFPRSARTYGNYRSHLPPPSPITHGVDNSFVGSSEEDGRGKLNNRPKRPVDSNIGRLQGNAWWGAPNWPSHMANGFLPFPHGPAAATFHPMMQQFPPQMFGVRPPMDHSGVPFHIPDGDRFHGYGRPFGWPNPVDETCPSPVQNWDSSTMVSGEGYNQGKLDMNQNRSLASASREPSVDRYKTANSSTVETPSGNRPATAEPIDDISSKSNHDHENEPHRAGNLVDNTGNDSQFVSKLFSDISASYKVISDKMSNAMVSEEKKKNADMDDHVHRSCAYLSKIDISAYLAHSDLFDQCASLLGIKQSTLSDTRMSRFSLEEENDVEGGSITTNSCISHVQIFTGFSDSLLEKAMYLYRQHRDDSMADYISSASKENQVDPTHKIQGSELAPTLDERGLQLGEVNFQLTEELPASNVNGDKATSPIISAKLEAPRSTSNEDGVNEPAVPIINTMLASEEAKEETMSRDVSENAREKRVADIPISPLVEGNKLMKNSCTDVDEAATAKSPKVATSSNSGAKNEADSPVEDDHCNKEADDAQTAVKTGTSDPIESSISNVAFESNEFGSVNLSWIHDQSPESTH